MRNSITGGHGSKVIDVKAAAGATIVSMYNVKLGLLAWLAVKVADRYAHSWNVPPHM